MRNITFEVRLFWYIANRTRNITFEARLFWFVTYKTRHIAFEVHIFRFRAYRTRNVTLEAITAHGIWLTKRGILHLKRASCGCLIEGGILQLDRACFGLWLIQRGTLHLKLIERGGI